MDVISAHGSTGALSSSVDSITVNTMHHSLSTPAGVDVGARTPPATPKKGGKMLAVRVQMLDDTVTIFQVQAKAMGNVLFDQVCKQLHLLEADYFGLEYTDTNGTKYWLDLQKPISRQLGLSLVDPFFQFCVKFYTPDPAQLEEEYTRYLFCLQVKRDLAQGIMQCNENTSAVMASYIVQAECGDFVPEDYPDHTYLSSYKFVPQQDREMEKKIMENHKKHTGQSPAEADLNLLETARRCELYGIKMHPAKDQENVPLNLAVAHLGIMVYQNYTKINTFSWAKIRKISFKRKRFLIKLHSESYGHYKDTVEFFFEGRNECKNFWKKCVENHGFFRCSSVKTVSRHKTRVLSRGSSFRYSGKTQKQIVEFVRDNYVKRQTFQRSHSFRHSSAHSSASNMHTSAVGNSISAHPLLPLADSNLSVEASKLSASLGSMGSGAVQGIITGARRPASPTMKSVSHHLGTATSWSSAPDNSNISPPITKTIAMVPRPPAVIPMMNSPSPTETRSVSEEEEEEESSGIVSPLTSPQHHQVTTTTVTINRKPASPLAVRAAVHRTDTGITMLTHISTRTPSSYKSEGSLDHSNTPVQTFSNNYCPSQTQSQNDIGPLYEPVPSNAMECPNDEMEIVPIKRKLWQRSASCKDLYDFSFEETGKSKHRTKSPRFLEKAVVSLDERKQDSPVTIYDDHRALYSTSSRDSSLEIQQDIMVPTETLFLNSYQQGSGSYSQESVEDPGNYDLRDSQEDLSHDSYELIEKSDESTSAEYKQKKSKMPLNVRSCSLDSGNYLPSDSESDHVGEQQKYRSISNQDICMMEDPRDYPREIVPRKSDGSFYKALKQNSRTSSLESRSDYYETTTLKSNRSKGIGSRTSSQESRGDYDSKKSLKKNKSADNLQQCNHFHESRASSVESKSEYFDAESKHEQFHYKRGDYDRKINFERNYGTQKSRHNVQSPPETILSLNYTDAKLRSINLQNVETEQSKRVDRILSEIEQNSLPISMKTHFTPDMPKSIYAWQEKCAKTNGQISTESDSNVFSFDEEKIQSIQENSDLSDHGFGIVPNIEGVASKRKSGKNYRDIFMEIEPRICHDLPLHQPIERTKSDPNSLARQRIHPNSRRLLLMHQKSIDLTPAESSDDDFYNLYKQIPPSAPPITKFKGTHFEMPTAEFGHFDILKREIEGQKTKFEVPKSQFEILGVKNQFDFMNLPPKGDEIPYVLHKRHVMNGTAKRTTDDLTSEEEFPNFPIVEKLKHEIIENENKPSSFLFTQNIDLSKVDPITLEIDKSIPSIQHTSSPKRDITHIDPVMLETLNSKLSQIESDSPTSSKTESLKPQSKLFTVQSEILNKIDMKIDEKPLRKTESAKSVPEITKSRTIGDKIKTDIKPKRVIKPRMQPGKKGNKTNKTKFRITSFSSDDESLDSDDVFGSAEATPTRIEFSPPQMRKEMESILKFESERKYLQYTMSSTEVEGSPPTTRKKPKESQDNLLELTAQQTELRRISERSLSIPSSEDELNIKTIDMSSVFIEPPDILKEVEEIDREADKSIDETLKDDLNTDNELTTIDEERAREKALLQAEIESDLRDLKVPSRTKITEIVSSSARSKGPSPLLFAHARLNLSEGSAFSLIQKQQAMESPIPGRRARSLDAPVVPVNKLPPINAFSSKDDTVEEELQADKDSGLENNLVSDKSIESESEIPAEEKPKNFDNGVVPEKGQNSILLKECDQIVPDLISNKKNNLISPQSSTIQSKTTPSLPPKGIVPPKPPKEFISKRPIKPTKELKPKLSRQGPTKYPPKPRSLEMKSLSKDDTKSSLGPKASSVEYKSSSKSISNDSKTSFKLENRIGVHKMLTQKAASAESAAKLETVQSSLTLPEIKRTKSQEMEPSRKTIPKEKARSFEKLELRRMGSKERQRSQEDNEEIIAERRKLQQMLYETAIKQTKTLKSPVKDVLPVFPQVEETVRERGGKLEISINTIEPNVSLEEAIIVTKSPKKLDKKLDKKLTKSLELNLSDRPEIAEKAVQRMGKSLDLERSKSEDEADKSTEFDFKPETIKCINDKDKTESPQSREGQQIVTVDVHSENVEAEEKIILAGASLDVWLSISDKNKSQLKDIKVIKAGNDFFENSTVPKAPDLVKKNDVKSKISSDTTSLETKCIDQSTELLQQSQKERESISELKKASDTVNKFLKRKLEKRRAATICSDKVYQKQSKGVDINQLTVTVTDHKDDLYKLDLEKEKVEDNAASLSVASSLLTKPSAEESDKLVHLIEDTTMSKMDLNLLGADAKQTKLKLLQKSSDHSKSSDTGSWTSGEKELSPGNVKETDESSVSCSMGRAIGMSQNIETFTTHSSEEQPRSPRSPRICVLGRAFTIDEDSQKMDGNSSSDEANDIPKDLATIPELQTKIETDDERTKKAPYPFEQKWSQDSELSQKLHKKLCKKMSSLDKGSMSSLDESNSTAKRNILDKPNLLSVEKLSTESRNSLDTESSSGSLGAAVRMQKSGDIPKELSSTWKPFPLDSSGSESFDDNLLPCDQEYFLCRDDAAGDFTSVTDVYYKPEDVTSNSRDDTELPEDLVNFSANFGYPCLSSLSGIGSTDVFAGYSGGTFLSRTLSRISERSTNSEKSSLDDDVTKASTQSDSLNDESVASSNPQVHSISSESPSHAHVFENDKKTPTNERPMSTNSKEGKSQDLSKHSDRYSTDPVPNINSLLQRQISDDRRTSAEMAELSMDDIEIITSERGLRLKRQGSDDTIIDEECLEETPYIEKQSSQDSDDWPLPEIPSQGQKPLLAMHETASTDTSQLTTQIYQGPSKSIPKTFGLRSSIKSQDSEQWPSPPSSIMEQPIVENVETYYVSPPEQAYRVTVESSNTTTQSVDDSNSDDYKTMEFETEGFHTYENVILGEYENIVLTEHVSESLSESQSCSVGPSGIKIVLEERSQDSNSDDDLNISNLNDDVFVDSSEMISKSEQLRPPTALRRSESDKRSSQKSSSSPAGSHSSYSEEECTSSLATNLEDGTVRFALKPTKCTHSSHSEDTSIALSLSEWSNSTNTVKFQNLSSNSGTTKSSSGLKSDENSLTDIAQSISEWSSTNSSTLKVQQQSGGGSHPFQKLSSGTSTGDSSTLTEFIAPSISDWSTSETAKSLVTQQFFPGTSLPEITSPRLMGSSIDQEESVHNQKSPKNIPSEDFSLLSSNLATHPDSTKLFTKSTERPILIPCVQIPSDTEKSSSSIEQKTVHIQRYDKDKKGYMQKYHTQLKSTDRPIKVNLKLAKCSPYYSSSLSSESTPLGGTSPVPPPVPPPNKTATVPLTRIHRKPISRNLAHAKSPTSENDSTSSVESPKSKSERERRGYRRKRQLQNQRNKMKTERDHQYQQQQQQQHCSDEFYYVEHDHGLTEYNEYIRERNMEEMASNFQYESSLAQDSPVLHFNENVEEGYYPDGDSQSGSDIFRDEYNETGGGGGGGFDVSSIPPPLLEDDFENDSTQQI